MFNGSSRVFNGGEIYIEHMTSALQGRLLSCIVFLGLLPLQTVRGRQRDKKAKRETERIYWRHLYTASLSGRTNLLVTLGWLTAGFPVTHYCQKVPNTHSLTHKLSQKESVYCTNCSAAQHAHSKPTAISQTGSNATFTEPGFPFRLSPHQAPNSPRTTQDSSHVNDLSLNFKSSLSWFSAFLPHRWYIPCLLLHLEVNSGLRFKAGASSSKASRIRFLEKPEL